MTAHPRKRNPTWLLHRSPSTSLEEDDDDEDEDEDFEEFEDEDSYEARPRAPKRARRGQASPPQRAAPQQSPSDGELVSWCQTSPLIKY